MIEFQMYNFLNEADKRFRLTRKSIIRQANECKVMPVGYRIKQT